MPAVGRLGPAVHTGSSLVEVAVSLLVISVGALGLAGMQISAKHVGHQALQRSEAVALARELLERMRINRSVLPAYAVNGIGAASGSALAEPAADCSRRNCSAAELGAWDLWQWQQALNGMSTSNGAGGLVRPTACVTLDGHLVTVAIAWEGFRHQVDPESGTGCGSGAYGEDDSRRRLLRLTSFIGGDPA